MFRLQRLALCLVISSIPFSFAACSGDNGSVSDVSGIALTNLGAFTDQPSKVALLFQASDKATGAPITDLSDADFNVSEGSLSITSSDHFRELLKREHLDYTIRTVLLIDVSANVKGNLETIKEAARRFVAKYDSPATNDLILDPETGKAVSNLLDQQILRIFTFSDRTKEVTNGWTRDADKLLNVIDSIELGPPSRDLYYAFSNGFYQWNDIADAENIIHGSLICITSAMDTTARAMLETLKKARGTKRVFLLAVGNEVDPTVLKDIASTGEYFPAADFSEVGGLLAQAQQKVRDYADSFYYLYYASPKRDGKHTVTLELKGNKNLSPDSRITHEFSASGFSKPLPEITLMEEPIITAGETMKLHIKRRWISINTKLHWIMKNPDVATIEADANDSSIAVVSGVTAGETTLVIVDAENSYCSAEDSSCGEVVYGEFTISVRELRVTGELFLYMGQKSQLHAETLFAKKYPDYEWKIGDEKVATVKPYWSRDPILIAVGFGSTTITVRDTANDLSKTLNVVVHDLKFEINGNLVEAGDAATITASHEFSLENESFEWSVIDEAACSLDKTKGPTVVAALLDQALICKVLLGDSGHGYEKEITVGSLNVTGEFDFGLGQNSSLYVKTINPMSEPIYTVEIEDEGVAKLQHPGSLSSLIGVGYGKTSITVRDTVNGITQTFEIWVHDLQVEVVGGLLQPGDIATLTAADTAVLDEESFEWSVIDEAACSLDKIQGSTVVTTLLDDALACTVNVSVSGKGGVVESLSIYRSPTCRYISDLLLCGECPSGYGDSEVLWDGNISSCEDNPCFLGTTCIDTADSFECIPLYPGFYYPVGLEPESIAAGDFDGDGHLDLAVANAGSLDVSVLLGDGAGNFYPTVGFFVGGSPTRVVVGDFNNDGNPDLAVSIANFIDNLKIYLGDGAGRVNTTSKLVAC